MKGIIKRVGYNARFERQYCCDTKGKRVYLHFIKKANNKTLRKQEKDNMYKNIDNKE